MANIQSTHLPDSPQIIAPPASLTDPGPLQGSGIVYGCCFKSGTVLSLCFSQHWLFGRSPDCYLRQCDSFWKSFFFSLSRAEGLFKHTSREDWARVKVDRGRLAFLFHCEQIQVEDFRQVYSVSLLPHRRRYMARGPTIEGLLIRTATTRLLQFFSHDLPRKEPSLDPSPWDTDHRHQKKIILGVGWVCSRTVHIITGICWCKISLIRIYSPLEKLFSSSSKH